MRYGDGGQLGAVPAAGLGVHVLEMRLHRAASHEQALGDLRVRTPLHDQLDDLLLGRRPVTLYP